MPVCPVRSQAVSLTTDNSRSPFLKLSVLLSERRHHACSTLALGPSYRRTASSLLWWTCSQRPTAQLYSSARTPPRKPHTLGTSKDPITSPYPMQNSTTSSQIYSPRCYRYIYVQGSQPTSSLILSFSDPIIGSLANASFSTPTSCSNCESCLG